MTVLSLFDGMSCGQIALRQCGLPVATYYASEVDRHAIVQTRLNFPGTVHLGDVRGVSAKELPPIDLLIGGSPCTDFSFAGKRRGMATVANEQVTTLGRYMELKRDGFEFVGQSYLFWEYVRLLHECREKNPGVLFLLENVEMGREREQVVGEALGIRGVHINSTLVSAQNRRRIYWTNIRTRAMGLFGDLVSDIPQPADRGILLRDILQQDVPERYYLSQKSVGRIMEYNRRNAALGNGFRNKPATPSGKAYCLRVGGKGGKDLVMQLSSRKSGGKQPYQQDRYYSTDGQTPFIMASRGRDTECLVARRNETGKILRGSLESGELQMPRATVQQLEPRGDGKTNTLTSVQKDNLLAEPLKKSDVRRAKNIKPPCGKAAALLATSYKGAAANGIALVGSPADMRLRRLTPTECVRLQTVPDWYRWECSETQQYRMLGNGWTVEVIRHIFSFIDIDKILKHKHLNTE